MKYNVYRRNSWDEKGSSFDYGKGQIYDIPVNTDAFKSLSAIKDFFFDSLDVEPLIVNIDGRSWAVYIKFALTGMDYINYFIIRE